MNNKLILVLALLLLSSCSANPLTLGAEKVRVTNAEPNKECSFLGDTTGSQGNFFTGSWTSNKNLDTGARNDLKNNAYAMGGNVVVILTQHAGITGSTMYANGSLEQTNVTLTGSVYKCP